MKSPRILIVEDDPLFVELYKTAFESGGYAVQTAFNGKQGLKVLSESDPKPAVILSDVMMPNMNGLEMLKKIKEAPALKNIPVILLTNLGSDRDTQEGLSLGAVTYLVKSEYTPKEVFSKVQEIIKAYTHDDHEVPEVKVPIKMPSAGENPPA